MGAQTLCIQRTIHATTLRLNVKKVNAVKSIRYCIWHCHHVCRQLLTDTRLYLGVSTLVVAFRSDQSKNFFWTNVWSKPEIQKHVWRNPSWLASHHSNKRFPWKVMHHTLLLYRIRISFTEKSLACSTKQYSKGFTSTLQLQYLLNIQAYSIQSLILIEYWKFSNYSWFIYF